MSHFHCMRTFALPPPSEFCQWNQCDIMPRGVSVMAIEFLTRYPTSECVVTRGDWALWGCVFDLFPKTLFHAFGGFSKDELRPNVIRHGDEFTLLTACRFSKRGTQYNLIFCGENMADQADLYKCGSPAAALMWITDPSWSYLSGEFLYPIHSGVSSSLCALVPCHHQMHPPTYTGLGMHMRAFQNFARFQGRSYDRDAEIEVLLAHSRLVSGISEPSTAMLMANTVRLDLPREDQPLLVFPLAKQPAAQSNEELPEHVHDGANNSVVQHDEQNHPPSVWSALDIENMLAQFLS